MRRISLPRWFRNSLLAAVVLSLSGYLARDFLFVTFLYRGTRADWELSQIPNECLLARGEYAEQVHRSGASPGDIERAKARMLASEAKLRGRCLTLAQENPATPAELMALYLVASEWPKTQDAENARGRLLELVVTADMQHWGSMFETTPVARDESLRPLAEALVRARRKARNIRRRLGYSRRHAIWSPPARTPTWHRLCSRRSLT